MMGFSEVMDKMIKVLQNMDSKSMPIKNIDCEAKVLTLESGAKYSLVTGERCG